MRFLIDANGGDNAPFAQIKAGVHAVRTMDIEIILVGDEEKIKPLLNECRYNGDKITIVDAKQTINNSESPVEAVKKKQNSSIVVASRLLKEKKADALITSGSTGAMLVCGQLIIGRIKGIKRPAIATVLPTAKGGKLLIDSGANTNCSEINLVQFAKMGSIYMENAEGISNPKVGLLSNGEEDEKGNAVIKQANILLKEEDINFIGNIEGRDIMQGNADVIVCDGFVGNVVLKTIEGTAGVLAGKVKAIFKKNIFTMFGALFVKKGIDEFKSSMDYREYGGAPLLGVKAPMIKAHGSSDEVAFYNAIRQAYRVVKSDICEKIRQIEQ